MTEDEIVTYLTEAREFASSSSSGIECTSAGTPCCLSWAGTKLETDFLFGDVDSSTGSVKVGLIP